MRVYSSSHFTGQITGYLTSRPTAQLTKWFLGLGVFLFIGLPVNPLWARDSRFTTSVKSAQKKMRDTVLPEKNVDPDLLYEKHQDLDYTISVAPTEIKIMTYNVQNLFDTQDDPGKKDETFLPKAHPAKQAACSALPAGANKKECFEIDWTQDRLDVKLAHISEVIDLQGSLPDLLAVQEIENANVAQQLADVLGYSHFVITNSPDERGIDVALFYKSDKLTFLASKETVVLFEEGSPLHKPTRNILTARFQIPGYPKGKEEYLGVYVNHWPSQQAPAEARYLVGKKLQSLIQADLDTYGRGRYHAVALGDFNTSGNDQPHPHFNTILDPAWKDAMKSVHSLMLGSETPAVQKIGMSLPPGTNFYPPTMSWNRFDQIFVDQSLTDGVGSEVLSDSFRIVAHSWITQKFQETKNPKGHMFASVMFGVPWRFDFTALTPDEAGYSDHLPVVTKIRLR